MAPPAPKPCTNLMRMKISILGESIATPVETAKIISDMMSMGLRPKWSERDPQMIEPIPMPSMAMESPICVMEGVEWNSRIMAGIVGRYMSFTSDEKAPIIAMKQTNRA